MHQDVGGPPPWPGDSDSSRLNPYPRLSTWHPGGTPQGSGRTLLGGAPACLAGSPLRVAFPQETGSSLVSPSPHRPAEFPLPEAG